MNIDNDLLLKIISKLMDKADPFYPVSHLAKDLRHDETPDASCACLSNAFVAHLLFLQDKKCIVNTKGENSWGYNAIGNTRNHSSDCENHFLNNSWETPHCYAGEDFASVIRLTADGLQLKTVLESSELTDQMKITAINAGTEGIKEACGWLVKVALGAAA